MALRHFDIGRESFDPRMREPDAEAARTPHLRLIRGTGKSAVQGMQRFPESLMALPSFEPSVLQYLARAAALDALRDPYRPDPDELPPFD